MKVNDLEEITHLLLSQYKEKMGEEINFKIDYYWDISCEEMYNPYEEPKNLTLGQLYDDIEDLERLKKNKNLAISYDLKRLASVLRALYSESEF